jgi:HAD superfamily hydrolase (TIGR01509 family)
MADPPPWAVRAVAFDLDGILIDTEPLFAEAVRRYLRRRGIPFDPAFMLTIMGTPDHQAVPAFIRTYRLTDPPQAVAGELWRDFLEAAGPGPAPLLPGVGDLLGRLRTAGIPSAITTSSGRVFVERMFAPHGLMPHFRFVLAAEDVTHGKPDPEIYRTAARRFGVEAGGMVVIEDSPNGLAAAKAAGARCVVVPHGSSPLERLRTADAIVPRLDAAELFELLGVV